jgi:hypothetical protein
LKFVFNNKNASKLRRGLASKIGAKIDIIGNVSKVFSSNIHCLFIFRLQYKRHVLIQMALAAGTVGIASAQGPEDPGSNPAWM